MGFDEGKVVFDHPDMVYYPGQVVKGRLEFQQTKDKTFRGIKLKAKGFCKTHWKTRHSRTSNGKSTTYSKTHEAYESYFERLIWLMGSENGDCNIKPGSYSFPFEVLIPLNVPSSYEAEHGHIRYTFKFVVDRAFKIDQEKKLTIKVVAPYDLNNNPYCSEPMVFNFDEPYSCCCTSQGHIETFAKVPKSGFCAGEIIPIELRCDNRSKLRVDKLKFEVKERITFHATDATKHLSRTIAKLKKGPVISGTSRNWELEMCLPPMEVYNVEICQHIDIIYDFEVEIAPEGCHSNTKAMKKIILGHIPLRMPQVETHPIQQPVPYPNLAPYPVGNQPNTYTAENSENFPYNANEKSSFIPGNSPYPENMPLTDTEKSQYVSSSPYTGVNQNPISPPYNPSVISPQTTPYPPYPTTSAMPMPGQSDHGSSNMPILDHGSSNMPILDHGSSNMPILDHGFSNMPILDHGSSNMPILGHGSSNMPILGHGSSNMPSVHGQGNGSLGLYLAPPPTYLEIFPESTPSAPEPSTPVFESKK